MKMFKVVVCILLCASIAACNSTKKTHNIEAMDSNYYVNSFEHTTFITSNKDSVKKQLGSDHELMMALLNRPVTQDQAMMLSITHDRINYFSNSYARGVSIKGARSNEGNYRNKHQYANLIAQDNNAVLISAPP